MADALNTKSPVTLTRDAKAAIQMAFEDLGGIPRLVAWATQPQNLGAFYTQIWSKIVPKDVKAEVDGKLVIEVVKFGEANQPTEISAKRMLDDGHIIETTASLIKEIVEDGTKD